MAKNRDIEDKVECDRQDCIHFDCKKECCLTCQMNTAILVGQIKDNYYNKVSKTGY